MRNFFFSLPCVLRVLPLVVAFLLPGPALEAQELTRIVAVVNDAAISAHDLAARFRFVSASTTVPQTDEERDDLLKEVLETLIDEQLKIQAAQRFSARITSQELDAHFTRFSALYGYDADGFRNVLEQANIPELTIWKKIDTDLRWSKIVESRVAITPEEIETEVGNYRNAEGTPEYLVKRIFLAVHDEQGRLREREHARRVRNNVLAGENFGNLALRHSHTPSNFEHGEWIRANALEAVIAGALAGMEKGEISKPLDTPGGVYLVELLDTRTVTLPEEERLIALAENELFRRAVDSLSRGLLRQLRATALIDRRI